jgi:hypothetical protein
MGIVIRLKYLRATTTCISLGLLLLTGCFAEINGGYYPSLTTEARPVAPAATVSQSSSALTFGINLGVYLDLFGAGVSYGFFGEDTVRGTSGLPEHFGGKGQWLRLDADLPLSLANGFIGTRATYAYESYDEIKAGPNVNRQNDSLKGDGRAHFGGFTFAIPGNDLSLALGARHLSMTGESDLGWPGFHVEGTGAAFRLMVRWIPTGTLFRAYEPSPIGKQGEFSCEHPNTKTVCSYGMSGRRCEEKMTCD